jgi:hypothetical protein
MLDILVLLGQMRKLDIVGNNNAVFSAVLLTDSFRNCGLEFKLHDESPAEPRSRVYLYLFVCNP